MADTPLQGLALGLLAFLSLLHLSQAATCYKSFNKQAFPNCLQVHPAFVVHWNANANTSKITFATDGDGYMSWFGVGVSEAGLKGFDFNIAIRGAQAQVCVCQP